MRTLIAALVVLAAVTVQAAPVWLDDPEAAFKQARREGKPVFLDYYAVWCPPCQDQDKALRGGALGELEQRLVFLHLDGDLFRDKAFLRRYPVTGYPTVWIIGPDGRPVDSRAGYEGEEDLRAFVSAALEGPGSGEEIEEDPAKLPDDPDRLYDAFLDAHFHRKAERAEALLGRIEKRRIDWDSAYESARFLECLDHSQKMETGDAALLPLLDAYLADLPHSGFAPSVAFMKAKTLRGLGRKADADALAADVVRRWPDTASSYTRLLEYSREAGALEKEAGEALERGLGKYPDSERFLTQAVLFLRDRDRPRALALAKKLKTLKPDNPYYDAMIEEVGP